ncbi:MAG: glycosidase, partial [Syntrophomonadaceae bacterium]|nr:glycosidase [Syntrophomonadaceae bacterium]
MAIRDLAETEALFDRSLAEGLELTRQFTNIDLVIGIPFYNERDLLPEVLKVVEESQQLLDEVRHPLILCVGDPAGAEAMAAIRDMKLSAPLVSFLMAPGANGRGASIRAILEIANRLESDVVLFAADLVRDEHRGLQPDWLPRIVEPLRHDYDLVLTTFCRHHFEDLLGSLFIAPLLEVFYGCSVQASLSGIYAMSHDTAEDLCTEIKFWVDTTQAFGIDPWLVTRAIRWQKKMCQVQLGAKLESVSLEKINYVFKEIARSLFECIKRDEEFWLHGPFVLHTPDSYGAPYPDTPYEPTYSMRDLVLLFKRSYNQYRTLYAAAMPPALNEELERIVATPTKEFRFPGHTWAQVVYRFLFHYWYAPGDSTDDVLNALTFAFGGRMAGFIEHIEALEEELAHAKLFETHALVLAEADTHKLLQRRDFHSLREEFAQRWQQKALEVKPPLIPAHYLEFIPGIPIVLPKRLEGRGGRVVWSEGLFNRLQSRYQERFNTFLDEGLRVPPRADSRTVAGRLHELMVELEKALDRLLPGDLYTAEGTEAVVEGLFRLLLFPRTYGLREEIFREMLLRFPPLNVMIPAGARTPRELMEMMDVRDAVSLANLVETRKYADRAMLWILDNLRPENMDEVEIRPIVLSEKVLGGTVRLGNISDLNKLLTRIVVRPISKGMGGEFPKLRFSLFVGRHIMIAENYAHLWRTYTRERKNLGVKIRNSLIGRYETGAFSAHNIFENVHHRSLVRHSRRLADRLAEEGRSEEARVLRLMCDAYGLSQVMADGTFIPCSAYTWASYSYKGGRGLPSPLSSHVEEKWFNHEFLEEIYSEMGYDPADIMRMVVQLIGEGRASENLLDVLLGIQPKDLTVVVQEPQEYPPAGQLRRVPHNPILTPIKEHYWESRYVLNAAAVRIKDKVYLLYRAFGDDEVSRIGLAITDGYHVLERLPEPIFVPHNDRDRKGVEDPRVVVIGNQLYMLYTAYNGVIAQVSAASISIDDFLARRWDRWERKGFAFQDIWDKDAILFPEPIDGKFIIYHRIEPSIWVSHLDRLEFPAPKERHSIILGPRSGQMWDSLKIGAGTQPI